MTLSELIAQLQAIEAVEGGDIPVHDVNHFHPICGDPEVVRVDDEGYPTGDETGRKVVHL
jgi:hypothetical protein